VLALIIFVSVVVFAWLNMPTLPQEPRWHILVIAGVGVIPVTLAWNAAEYHLTARLAGYSVSSLAAVRTSIFASLANLLPIPGALLVRAKAMHAMGASLGKVAFATVVVGLGFAGMATTLLGVMLVARRPAIISAVVLAMGLTLLISGTVFAATSLGLAKALPYFAKVMLIETGSVVTKALTLYLILEGLGQPADALQALALATSGVLAMALGFFPAGLGISELFAGIVSPLVDLPASLGVLAAAMERILQVCVLGSIVLAMLARGNRWRGSAEPERSNVS
jgi:hypothetical protein